MHAAAGGGEIAQNYQQRENGFENTAGTHRLSGGESESDCVAKITRWAPTYEKVILLCVVLNKYYRVQ